MVHPEEKIKVVFVITGTGVGGAEKMLYHTCTLLDHTRYLPCVCSLKEKGATARNMEAAGIEVHCLTMRDGDHFGGWFASLTALFRLTRLLMKVRPAIVHSFLFRANILARIAAWLVRVPVVISSVRVMGGEKSYYHTIEKITSYMVDHYSTVSESVKAHLVRTAGIPESKITTIYNGIAPHDQGASLGGEKQLLYGLTAQDRLLLAVGRLHRQKGYDTLIRAFARVRKECFDLRLLIVGEGEEENSLKNLAISLDLKEQVIFAGLRLDSDRIFPLAELYVISSLWEGMPNAVLEAMAAGIPVVATNVGGVPELVLHGETGLLVPPGDPDALARAILDLCTDHVKAQKMGEAGRVRVHEHFRITSMIEKTEGLYQQLLVTKRPL